MRKIFLTIIISISFLSLAQVFKDVPQNHWAYQAIENLYSAGILTVSGEKFNGDQPPSRYEMAVVVYRLKRYLEDKFERDVKAIKRKLAGLDISSLESTLEEMRSFKLSVEDKLKDWNSQIENMKKSFEGLKVEIAKVLENQSNYEIRLNEIGRQLGGIMVDVSNIKKALGLTDGIDVGKLKGKVIDLEEKIAGIEVEFRKFKGNVERKLEIAIENTDSLKEMIKDVESKISSSECENIEYPRGLIETLSSSVSNLRIRLETIESEIEKLDSKFSESLRKNSEIIAEIQSEISNMKKSGESLFEDFKMLAQKIENALKTSLDNSSAIEEMRGKIDVLKENLLKIDSKFKELDVRFGTLESSLSALESRPATPECCDVLEFEVSQLKSELVTLSKNFEIFKSSMEGKLKKLKSEFTTKEELESLRKSISNFRETVSSSITTLWNELSRIDTRSRDDFEKLSREVARDRERISKVETEISKINETLESNSSRIERMYETLNLLKNSVESVKKTSDANSKNLEVLSKGLSSVSETVKNLSLEVSKFKVSVSNLATNIESLKRYTESNFKITDGKIETLKGELEDIKKVVETTTSDLQKSIESEREMRSEMEKIVNVNRVISLFSVVVSLFSVLGLVLILVMKTP